MLSIKKKGASVNKRPSAKKDVLKKPSIQKEASKAVVVMKKRAADLPAGEEDEEEEAEEEVEEEDPVITPIVGEGYYWKKRQNETFEAKNWGTCKAEYYSKKSYIRHYDGSGSLRLIVGDESPDHMDKIAHLVQYVKDGATKEKLKELRSEWKK